MSRSQWSLIGLILALAVGRLAYDLLVSHHLEQTAALFIGLPAILAIILASTSPARNATGVIIKGMTIALLLAGVVLPELAAATGQVALAAVGVVGVGLVCIIIAAPLFLSVGAVVGLIYYIIRILARLEIAIAKRIKGLYVIAMVPFLILSAEGVDDRLAFPRAESVTAERVIPVSATEVERFLSRTPRFDKPLPIGLRLGFPRPVGSAGEGLQPGDRRIVHFASRRGRIRDLTLEVAERGWGTVRFQVLSDSTHIAEWLQWQEAEVRWTELDGGHTLMRWTLRYRRRLDPAWYFGPLERIAVQAAAAYLIDNLATPP
jgi:hypothetical protein